MRASNAPADAGYPHTHLYRHVEAPLGIRIDSPRETLLEGREQRIARERAMPRKRS
jgi:hypothetical protein